MDPLTMTALGLGIGKAGADIWGGVSTVKEAGRRRRDEKEIALKRLALTEKEIAQQEKQRTFERLLKLISGSQALRESASAAGRLRALRSA